MEVDAQRVVIGLTTGAVYGLLALGFVVIYRASKVLNFAEAGVGAVGAYLLYDLMEGSGGGWGRFLLALAAGLAAAALLGVAIERLAVRPLRRAPAIAPLVATVGVLLLAQAVVTIRYTGQAVTIENPLPSEPYRIGRFVGLDRVVITGEGTVLLAVLVAVGLALMLLVGRTRWGLAVRAVSEDVDSAAELGVRTGRVSMSAWALGSAVGALASMLFATTSLLTPVNLAFLQVKALVVAVFAGLSDLRLCLIGGPLLGVVEQLATRTDVAGLDQSIGFFALLAVLLLRSRTLVAEARA
jgi:branched-subunit amino acid ABC-type transport system permease component